MTGEQPLASGEAPTLIAVAHGTRDPRGPRTVSALVSRVRALCPELPVREAYVELNTPSLADALAACPGPVVVVPLLFGTGYHVTVDLPQAVAGHRAPAVISPPLGPHPLLAEALHARLREAGWRDGPVVLAAAGSSHVQPCAEARATAALLADRLGVPVTAAYASAARPRVAEAVRAAGADAAVASYLLAPGHFHDVVVAAGAAVTGAPLGAHGALARLVLHRYDSVAGAGAPVPRTSEGGALTLPR